MRPITARLLGSLSVLWIVAPTPSDAAVIRQNFELTVTSLGYRSGDAPSTVPLPPIGTKGTGSFTYDEADIHYINEPYIYPIGYYLGYLRSCTNLNKPILQREKRLLSFSILNKRSFSLGARSQIS